jgi:hypothetical protein
MTVNAWQCQSRGGPGAAPVMADAGRQTLAGPQVDALQRTCIDVVLRVAHKQVVSAAAMLP